MKSILEVLKECQAFINIISGAISYTTFYDGSGYFSLEINGAKVAQSIDNQLKINYHMAWTNNVAFLNEAEKVVRNINIVLKQNYGK